MMFIRAPFNQYFKAFFIIIQSLSCNAMMMSSDQMKQAVVRMHAAENRLKQYQLLSNKTIWLNLSDGIYPIDRWKTDQMMLLKAKLNDQKVGNSKKNPLGVDFFAYRSGRDGTLKSVSLKYPKSTFDLISKAYDALSAKKFRDFLYNLSSSQNEMLTSAAKEMEDVVLSHLLLYNSMPEELSSIVNDMTNKDELKKRIFNPMRSKHISFEKPVTMSAASSDGESIVIVRGQKDSQEIMQLDLNSGLYSKIGIPGFVFDATIEPDTQSITFNKDDSCLVMINNGVIKLWDLKKKKFLNMWQYDNKCAAAFSFSPVDTDKYAAFFLDNCTNPSGGEFWVDNQSHIVSRDRLMVDNSFTLQGLGNSSLIWSPNGKKVLLFLDKFFLPEVPASSQVNTYVWCYDLEDPTKRWMICYEDLQMIAFTPDGHKNIYVYKNSLSIVDTNTQREIVGIPIAYPLSEKIKIGFTQDSKICFLVDSCEGFIVSIDIETGATKKYSYKSDKNINKVKNDAIAFSQDGQYMVALNGSLLSFFTAETGEKIASYDFSEQYDSLQFSADGNHLLLLGKDGVDIWQVSNDQSMLLFNMVIKKYSLPRMISVYEEYCSNLVSPDDLVGGKISKKLATMNSGFLSNMTRWFKSWMSSGSN